MSNDDFMFNPPHYSEHNQYGSFLPANAHAAWMLQLIKIKLENTNLPEDIKKDLIADMMPYLDNASMTNITKGQVREFIGGFNELWLRYRIFKVKKKYAPQLNYVMAYIRELLVMNLNKSVTGWQGNHVFESKTTYDIRQTRKDVADKLKGIFSRKTRSEDEGGGYQE